MIRNIIFDMGNVLVRFDPEHFMDTAGITDRQDRELIRNELFRSAEWAQMDLGILTEETAEPLILARFPERLQPAVSQLLFHWADQRETVPGMVDLLERLKKAGYSLYLLSNASVMQHHYWPRFPMSALFDGKLISCDVGIVKPNPAIYMRFSEQFGLQPDECLFIDDQPSNIAAAIQCGWSGIVFHGNAEEAEKKLIASGVSLQPETLDR